MCWQLRVTPWRPCAVASAKHPRVRRHPVVRCTSQETPQGPRAITAIIRATLGAPHSGSHATQEVPEKRPICARNAFEADMAHLSHGWACDRGAGYEEALEDVFQAIGLTGTIMCVHNLIAAGALPCGNMVGWVQLPRLSVIGHAHCKRLNVCSCPCMPCSVTTPKLLAARVITYDSAIYCCKSWPLHLITEASCHQVFAMSGGGVDQGRDNLDTRAERQLVATNPASPAAQ
jgi:hypothetical protein